MYAGVRCIRLFLAAMLLTSVLLPPLRMPDTIFLCAIGLALTKFKGQSLLLRKYETTILSACAGVAMCFVSRRFPYTSEVLFSFEDVGPIGYMQSYIGQLTLPWFYKGPTWKGSWGVPFNTHFGYDYESTFSVSAKVLCQNLSVWACAAWATFMLERKHNSREKVC